MNPENELSLEDFQAFLLEQGFVPNGDGGFMRAEGELIINVTIYDGEVFKLVANIKGQPIAKMASMIEKPCLKGLEKTFMSFLLVKMLGSMAQDMDDSEAEPS